MIKHPVYLAYGLLVMMLAGLAQFRGWGFEPPGGRQEPTATRGGRGYIGGSRGGSGFFGGK